MSGHANGINNNGHHHHAAAVTSSQGGYPANAWAFAAADFNAAASPHHTTIAAAAAAAAAAGVGSNSRPLLASSHYGGQQQQQSGSKRYRARTGPYEGAAARRGHLGGASSSSSSRKANGQRQGDPERKRVVVACGRCRKRKIRCSGDDGMGGACTACKNANEPLCIFMRVSAGSITEMRKKEEAKRRMDEISQVNNTFNYDLDVCRQYQSRGAAAVGPAMGAATSAPSMAYSGSNSGSSNVVYAWVPGVAGGYAGNGNSGGGGGAENMAYGLAYGGLPYNGMPSPDASYMGENDLMERPTTSSMADAGAFALQSLSQGLPAAATSNNNRDGGHMPTPTPQSLPGPAPAVLGSTRGVPPSSVFSASRAPQQYPSPATTPITSGVSPVWTGYEQSPYASATMTTTTTMPAGMAAQSLERLPDLYSASPPPPPPPQQRQTSSAESAAGVSMAGSSSRHSSQSGEDLHHHHQQQQNQHFGGFDFGESRGQAEQEDAGVV
ncbi:hypothetical protein PWT90_10353 [Aphanocladium album]|nr:hypothetical protein PWT90_10353 [Aphanocladium album]